MKGPPDRDKGPEDVPPGGKAFQRIQQDRIARGLDPIEDPEDLTSENEKKPPKKEKPKPPPSK
jgi:hypothetical protein